MVIWLLVLKLRSIFFVEWFLWVEEKTMSYSGLFLLQVKNQRFQRGYVFGLWLPGYRHFEHNAWWHHDDTKHLAFPWMSMNGTLKQNPCVEVIFLNVFNQWDGHTLHICNCTTDASVLPSWKPMGQRLSHMWRCAKSFAKGKTSETKWWCSLCWVVTYNLNLFQGFIFKQPLIL